MTVDREERDEKVYDASGEIYQGPRRHEAVPQ